MRRAVSPARSRSHSPSAPFNPFAPLIVFNRLGDGIGWHEALAGGLMCLADSGSGKTTGPLSVLTRRAHRAGATVVHTCVKPGDAVYWQELAVEEGREPLVFRFGTHSFNPLAYEQFRPSTDGGGDLRDPGRLIEALTQKAVAPLLRTRRSGGEGGGGGGDFWLADSMRYVRQIVTIYVLSETPLSFEALAETLLNLPRSHEQTHDAEWQERCPAYAALLTAESRLGAANDPAARRDLDRAAAFLLRTIPTIPEKTRESTVATYVSAIDPYLRGVVGTALNPPPPGMPPEAAPSPGNEQHSEQASVAGTISQRLTPFSPFDAIACGRPIILDLPLQVWGESGAIVQRFVVTALQDEIIRRNVTALTRPVVFVMDECQEFLDASADAAFMRTARDRLGCMWLATQCVGNLVNACAGARDARAAAETILGLPSVKLFGATSDPQTLEFASRVFTNTPQSRFTINTAPSPAPKDGKSKSPNTGGKGPGGSVSMDLQPDVPPHEIARLKRGGPANGFQVEMFCAVTGRIWKASHRPSLKISFTQAPPAPGPAPAPASGHSAHPDRNPRRAAKPRRS